MTDGAVNQSPGMNEREGVVERAINEIVQRVSEWDDRTSPEDWPEAMLITADELRDELRGLASVLAPAPSAWQPMETAPKDGTFIHVWFPDNGDDPASQCLTCSWKLLPESGLTKGAWFAQSGGRAFRMGGATHWKPMDGPSIPSSDRGGVG